MILIGCSGTGKLNTSYSGTERPKGFVTMGQRAAKWTGSCTLLILISNLCKVIVLKLVELVDRRRQWDPMRCQIIEILAN